MAKTLLNGVNDVLEKLGLIHGDTAVLTTLTDSARQRAINLTIDSWNEVITNLYSYTETPRPNELAENTITLVTSDRDYALQTDLVLLHFPLRDETNGHVIDEYPGGYLQLVNDQIYPSQENGLPQYGVIRPTDGELYLDKIPSSNENGLVFKYRYDKELLMSAAADTMPFTDTVYTALLPAVTQHVARTYRRTFDTETYNESLGTAARLFRMTPQRSSYIEVMPMINPTDPYA